MKALFALFVLLWLPVASLAQEDWVDRYDALLEKYVRPDGVRYEAWHQHRDDLGALAEVAGAIAEADVAEFDEDARLAFYLNAYNALILHRILAAYPTKGPGGGGFFGRNSFFKSKNLTVAGATTSFHLLENEIIRPEFGEPRIHFALNCASRSCPPLHNRAFRGEDLDETLTRLTTAFINTNPNGVRSERHGRSLRVSKIFKWYREDFASAGGVLAYINQYRDEAFPEKARIRYQTYHWTLNASAAAE